MLRIPKELVRRPTLENRSPIHKQYPVGDFPREPHLMRDTNECHSMVRKISDNNQHLTHHLRIERAGRLVKEHDRRLRDQCARDGDALLLASGEFRGESLRLISHAHTLCP
jgi:hypothetical protein